VAAPPRIPPVRTVALESLADLQAFRGALSKRLSLPRVRIALRLIELAESAQGTQERQINRLLDVSGQVEGLATAVLLLALTALFPLSPAGPGSIAGLIAWGAQGLFGVALGFLTGKLLGQWVARLRLKRLCARIEAEATRAR
jgi:hypothetical protein